MVPRNQKTSLKLTRLVPEKAGHLKIPRNLQRTGPTFHVSPKQTPGVSDHSLGAPFGEAWELLQQWRFRGNLAMIITFLLVGGGGVPVLYSGFKQKKHSNGWKMGAPIEHGDISIAMLVYQKVGTSAISISASCGYAIDKRQGMKLLTAELLRSVGALDLSIPFLLICLFMHTGKVWNGNSIHCVLFIFLFRCIKKISSVDC